MPAHIIVVESDNKGTIQGKYQAKDCKHIDTYLGELLCSHATFAYIINIRESFNIPETKKTIIVDNSNEVYGR